MAFCLQHPFQRDQAPHELATDVAYLMPVRICFSSPEVLAARGEVVSVVVRDDSSVDWVTSMSGEDDHLCHADYWERLACSPNDPHTWLPVSDEGGLSVFGRVNCATVRANDLHAGARQKKVRCVLVSHYFWFVHEKLLWEER